MTTQPSEWDTSYQAATPPPWDIGRPQPAFARLADGGLLGGQVLDADAVGVDVSARAIDQARAKAAERGVTARFEVGDALNLGQLGITVDTVIDSGLFHVFDDQARTRYVTSLASVLKPGGMYYLMCFSDRQPGDWGPRRVRQDELAAAFADGWAITSIEADTFVINPTFGATTAQAWLATLRRR